MRIAKETLYTGSFLSRLMLPGKRLQCFQERDFSASREDETQRKAVGYSGWHQSLTDAEEPGDHENTELASTSRVVVVVLFFINHFPFFSRVKQGYCQSI